MGSVSSLLLRSVHLLGIVLAPPWVSPEPLAASPRPSSAFAAALVLGGIAAAAIVLGRSADRRRKVVALLIALAVLAAVAGAAFTMGGDAPLGRAALPVAPFVWSAAAALVWVAGERFGRRATVAAGAVLALGVLFVAPSAGMLRSSERMWWQTLRRDPEHAAARAAFVEPMLQAGRHEELVALTESCPSSPPEIDCGCRELGIEAENRAKNAGAARDAAQALAPRCPERASFAALHAEALALAGDSGGAIAEASRGLGLALRRGDEARLRYALALGLERGGRYGEAAAEVERAIAAGAGPDAALLASALAILRGDYERATEAVRAVLAERPDDPRARYNEALIADHRGRYNEARQGYLAVLSLDPNHADARFNLARLTWRAGVKDEARHHARRFTESFPQDPRAGELKKQMQGD